MFERTLEKSCYNENTLPCMQIDLNDFLKVKNLAFSPILDILRPKQSHTNQNINNTYIMLSKQYRFCRLNDALFYIFRTQCSAFLLKHVSNKMNTLRTMMIERRTPLMKFFFSHVSSILRSCCSPHIKALW